MILVILIFIVNRTHGQNKGRVARCSLVRSHTTVACMSLRARSHEQAMCYLSVSECGCFCANVSVGTPLFVIGLGWEFILIGI